MNFHRPNKPFLQTPSMVRKAFFLLLLIAVVFVVDFASDGTVRSLSRTPYTAISQMRANVFDSVTPLSAPHDTDAVRAYITKLENEREAYIYTQLTNALLRAENRTLLAQLANTSVAQETQSTTAKTAHRVMSVGDSFPYGTIITEKNSNSYVNDATVFAGGTLAIGSIESIDAHSLLVRFFSAPKRNTDAFIFVADEAIPIVLTGIGGGNFTTSVPRDIAVSEGAVVVLAESTTHAVLGIVGSVEADETDAFKTVRVSVPVNLKSLRYVFIDQ